MNEKKVNFNVRVSTLLTRMGLTDAKKIREYMVGKSIIPVVNTNGGQTQYPLNEPIKIDDMTQIQGNATGGSCYGMPLSSGYAGGSHVYWCECILAPDNKETLEKELETWAKREKEIQTHKELISAKLTYLEETKSERVDNTDFKKYLIKNVLLGKKLDTDAKIAKVMELLAL